MMKKMLFALILFVGLMLQITVFPHFKILGIQPDIVLVVVLAIAFFHGSYRGMAFGFWSGLLEDIFSAAGLGTNALSKVLCAFLVSSTGSKMYENFGTQALIIVLFSILDRIFTWIISFFSSPIPVSVTAIPQIIVYALYNLAVGIFVFPLIKKISGRNERINHS